MGGNMKGNSSKGLVVKVAAGNNWSESHISATAEQFLSEINLIVRSATASNADAEVEIYDSEGNLVGYFRAINNKLEYTVNNEKLMSCLCN
jgi:hypothetical protein